MTRRTAKIFFFTVLLLFPPVSMPQSVTSIKFTGAVEFPQRDYINWIGIIPGADLFPFIEDTISARIGAGLAENGYLNSSVSGFNYLFNSDSSKVEIEFEITEGSPTVIDSIEINGAGFADSSFVNFRFGFLKGTVINRTLFEETVSEVLDYYENNGFPFASVSVTSINFKYDSSSENHLADLHLLVSPGQQSEINKIEIIGNTKTKDYVITRSIRFDDNEKYSQERIDQIPKRLNRLRFFEPVEAPSFYLDSKNNGVLQIKIKERETNNFDGILGYIPGNAAGEKGYFTGFVSVSLRNLFGTGRGAAVRWQQENRFSQELELRYLEPWLFGFPFNIDAGLFQRKQDTTYVIRKVNASAEYLATEDISAALTFSSESAIPTESETAKFTIFNSSIITTGVNLKIDTRDDFYAPTEGIYFLNSYKYSRKKINGPERFITASTIKEINIQRFELDFIYFLEIFSRQVAALGLHGREMRGPAFEISDLYQFGGTNTLRGYRENQFLGNRIFWSNLEYRYLLTRRSFAFLFFDTGYYLRGEEPDKLIQKTEAFKIGYGLGLNIETALGVLGVSFALAKGDSFGDGKIHFAIINEF